MNKKKLGKFLDNRPGYIKFGSNKLIDILRAKGFSLASLTQEQVKEVLRDKARGYSYIPKKAVPKKAPKILMYDLETSYMTSRVWWTGKQYVGYSGLRDETQIISVHYKWVGDSKVHNMTWDKKGRKGSDKNLIADFAKIYNEADMVITFNGNSFDNKLVNTRAMKYGLSVNTFIKSYDIYRLCKSKFRLPSYSLQYISKFLGLAGKYTHDGISMWEDIIETKAKSTTYKNAIAKMLLYGDQDVLIMEEVYMKLRKYFPARMHVGVLQGKGKTSCPTCGSTKTKLHSKTTSPAGTIQVVYKCKKDKTQFKVSNTEHLKTI